MFKEFDFKKIYSKRKIFQSLIRGLKDLEPPLVAAPLVTHYQLNEKSENSYSLFNVFLSIYSLGVCLGVL